jgi:hypothetical protein
MDERLVPTEFDKRDYYDKHVAGIVKALKVQCTDGGLPMFVTVAVANNAKGTEYKSSMVLGVLGNGVALKDNNVAKCVLLLNDFENIPPENVRDAARIVNDYIRDTYEGLTGADSTDVLLTRDVLEKMARITCGDEVKVIREKKADKPQDGEEQLLISSRHSLKKKKGLSLPDTAD